MDGQMGSWGRRIAILFTVILAAVALGGALVRTEALASAPPSGETPLVRAVDEGAVEGEATAPGEGSGAAMTSAEKPSAEKGEPAGMSVGSIELLVFMALFAMLMIISYRGPKSRLSK